MPRDKTLSHIRVNRALKEEFLEKGFKGASVRNIGKKAGMTSAGLYRHYPDKESMFNAVVEPLVFEIRKWTERHIAYKNGLVEGQTESGSLFGETIIDLIRDVILPRRDEFMILMNCSAGTGYENFIHDYALENQKEILKAINVLKDNGYPVKEISEEELHILMSAFLTACFEAVIHDYDDERIERYLQTIQEFFMPGWMKLLGIQ